MWRDGKTTLAHRKAWEDHYGPIPAGLCVCHHCDIRSCINPSHLFLATQAQNIADKVAKGRQAKGTASGRYTMPWRTARGSSNGYSKLDEDKVRAIKKLLRDTTMTHKDIAEQFCVERSAVTAINRGKNWRHIMVAGVA